MSQAPKPEEMIFVFGSNLAGRHGAGAAKFARRQRNAVYGVGEGMTGKSYALPTCDENIEPRTLFEIKLSVESFITTAVLWESWGTIFQVTRVGCGLGGHLDADIAPMFREAPNNCYFDEFWKPWLDTFEIKRNYWGTF